MSLNKENLKVGDWVIANKKANLQYIQTIEGWEGQVTHIYNTCFDAEGLNCRFSKTEFVRLDFDCFDKFYQSSAEELKEILKF